MLAECSIFSWRDLPVQTQTPINNKLSNIQVNTNLWGLQSSWCHLVIYIQIFRSCSSFISSTSPKHPQYIADLFILWFLQGIHHDYHTMPSLSTGEMYSFLLTMFALNLGRSTIFFFYNIGEASTFHDFIKIILLIIILVASFINLIIIFQLWISPTSWRLCTYKTFIASTTKYI